MQLTRKFSYSCDIHFKVITRIMTYNIIPEHIRFLEISCTVWNIYINIFPYKQPKESFVLVVFWGFFLYRRFLLVINFICTSVYMSIPIAQFSILPSPPHHGFPPLMSICLFSTSVSQLLPCKPVHLYHFSRFHIHALIYDICFSLSDLLHSVWQSLDPSTDRKSVV